MEKNTFSSNTASHNYYKRFEAIKEIFEENNL